MRMYTNHTALWSLNIADLFADGGKAITRAGLCFFRSSAACTAAAAVVGQGLPPLCVAGFDDGTVRSLQSGSDTALAEVAALPVAIAALVADHGGHRVLCCGR